MDDRNATWHRSSYSTQGGNCVEVGANVVHTVPVRDSKDPHGPALVFSADAWSSFVVAVRSGEFGDV
ncbi:DUF397 domain-containing protein [Kitasatospora sp. NBC_01300]|uniref:DUF397 domain-containing protein n=1 Tax=Kitasatospora sp. NBC_01300 TaxID=2903574 RepID=UPI00352EFC1B|nr:DUF397 domain-containing protein [Kitasatospora sp. NBC_01300]WSK08395.1 DUF397 domain-containing protein [Kitasatospora sp. NBC_01300]